MSEFESIQSALQQAAARKRSVAAWRGFWKGLFVGALVCVVALTIYKIAPVPKIVVVAGCALGVFCALAGAILGGWRKSSLASTAQWLDEQRQLKERLSTALEVSQSSLADEWKRLVVADAARHLPELQPAKLLPFDFPKVARWAVLAVVLAVGLGFVPEYRSPRFTQKKHDSEIIKDAGRQLAELTRRSLEVRPPALEPAKQSLEAVNELGEHLAKAELTRAEALRDLSSATEKLKEQVRELGRNPAFKSMEKAARSVDRGGTPSSAEMQKQMEALQKELGNQPKDPDAIEKFKKDVQQAREAAANLPDKDSKAGTDARQNLAQSLSDLSRRAQEMGLSLPALEEAISALAASQTDQLVRDLKTAEIELEKLQSMAKAMAELQAQADKQGKDLAEQLEFGQAEAAQKTLTEMARQMQSEGMSAEQMQKMLEELSKAVNPASQYGKAAEKMKDAMQQMQTGDKAQAAQSLQSAAQELQNMLQQMGDMQSMMTALDAMQQAQMAIANGQAWSQSQSQPRGGRGSGVGRGVGTWADDSRLMEISDIKDRWDNSGVVRDDEESRGHTDRGDSQLADNLAPTKVKGQITPGGPMPSITLKGVSIKGMSRVDLQEASTAAQSEAQSALSQEQVPRAYRGAVRDYFDDLKK